MQAPDNFSYVVPIEEFEHSSEKPFCWNNACPCHEDIILISEVAQQVQDGLFTPQEATDFTQGKGI
jgi:hypothetical protein